MRVQRLVAACLILAGMFNTIRRAHADAVTDWNAVTEQAIRTAAQGPPVQGRFLAIVHASIFDAVNGIEREYTPYFVWERGPRRASAEAAAVQAAYTALVGLYPTQTATFDAQLAISLANIPGYNGNNAAIHLAIDRGREWGEYVAQQILAWRSTDGFTAVLPGYFGGTNPGVWRSPPAGASPDGTLPAVFRQLAIMVPFAIDSPEQFRPGPHPGIDSRKYANHVNEVKALGRFDSVLRTPEQTQIAQLWAAVGPAEENRAIRPVIESLHRPLKLVDTARIFALINIAAADATIAGMDSKYAYNLWRPYHAIRLAGTDGNPWTVADTTWNSLIVAPRFQEYVSLHSTVTTAFMSTLAELIGDRHTFTLDSPAYPGFTWTFDRFSDAAEQVIEARIWGGIHYRFSCDTGARQGDRISRHVVNSLLLPLDYDWDDRN